MLTCWFFDPETRPKFTKIAEDLSHMALDAKRYVVITPTGPKSARTPKNSVRSRQDISPTVFDEVDQSGEVDLDVYLFEENSSKQLLDDERASARQDHPVYANAPFINQQTIRSVKKK